MLSDKKELHLISFLYAMYSFSHQFKDLFFRRGYFLCCLCDKSIKLYLTLGTRDNVLVMF